MLFARFLSPLMKNGTLIIINYDGKVYNVGNGGSPKLTVKFHDPKLGRNLFLNPALYAGEAYMDGTLTIEDGSLFDLLDLVMSNIGKVHGHWASRSLRIFERFSGLLRTYNPVSRAKKNVAHHYDLSSSLYENFLDPDMQYSMAYYKSSDVSLTEAQADKINHIASKLCLSEGMNVLDVGCGWGGLALALNKKFKVNVTGISLSREQLKIANKRAEAAGVQDQVSFLYEDYRNIKKKFDRIVSVGMFEHVGLPKYNSFFRCMRKALKDDGIFLLHTIGRADGPGATDSWTLKYIFPGGYAPGLSEIIPHAERHNLFINDVEVLRLHYAYTLRDWRKNFMKNSEIIKETYDERFCRMWEFFLASAESSFRNAWHVNFHIQMSPSLESIPLTREYMYK
ncbi:MAG: hypothetical protein CBC47_06750 [Alphaproteobacteria bacterium TMED87]|nr:SAM-dependent methyltransferase [Rhodospirillaceae bacterium]OUV08788.1 MAG: hypothetical protein CBC47_06750 [Alphaproteobacteria bacterium TMED87]